MNSKERKTLSSDKRRDKIMATKVNSEQCALIKKFAKECGLSVSDYLLMCACRCHPKARLTPEQERLMANLINLRTDIVRFFSAFKGLSAEQRKLVIINPANMRLWLDNIRKVANQLNIFLHAVYAPNIIPEEKNHNNHNIE